jgi:hypothetical protein
MQQYIVKNIMILAHHHLLIGVKIILIEIIVFGVVLNWITIMSIVDIVVVKNKFTANPRLERTEPYLVMASWRLCKP